MPVVVKKLYMAKSFDALKKKSAIDPKKSWKNKPPDVLISSVEKVYAHALAALDNEGEKDEELVFMYLFRAMELWNIIMQSEEYHKDKKYFNLMCGSKITNTMTLLEDYEKKLKKRYGTQDNEKNSNLDVFNMSSSIDIRRIGTNKNKTVNGVKKPPDSSGDTFLEDANGFWIKTDPPKPNDNDYYGEKKFIQCEELKEPVLASFNEVLILDTRPKRDFELSKIAKIHSVNIPGSLITAGLSANKLGALIADVDEKSYWNQRDKYEHVVLLDWHSEERDVIPSSHLDNLLNILLKWDPDCIYKKRPLVLAGGFERWLDMYPTLTTNPQVHCPQKPLSSFFTHLSDHNIDYPMNELEELITPTPAKPLEPLLPRPTEAAILKPTSKPTVDRTTKPDIAVERRLSATGGKGNQEEDVLMTDKTLLPAGGEPIVTEEQEPEKMHEDESIKPSPKPASSVHTKEKPRDQNTTAVRPQVTPKRPTAPYSPPTPQLTPTSSLGKVADKGDGDTETSFERLKSLDIASRGSGLKRSASSPNINKMVEDSDSSSSISFGTPKFDRSTKPKPTPYDSPRTTDTIYAAHKGRGLTGLKNLGNLCYMNSIMQCLSNTVELSRELTQFRYKELSSGRNHIAAEVAQLLRTLWGETRLTSCRGLKSRVGVLRNSFSTNEQQDSHEFLTLLVDWLHDDLNQIPSCVVLDGAQEPTGEKAWGEFRQKNNSIVLDLFYGQLKSTVTCNHCREQSVLFEPFSNLSVPLPTSSDKESRFTLEECMKLYLSGEQVSGWTCPSCKVPRDATKKLDITRLPPVLIIHLKRFMTDSVGTYGWCRKRMNMVDFPITSLDMQPFTHPNSELRFHNYNLYAVSNHYGNMDSGHYTAYCKNHMLHKWYRFDDTDVNEMSPTEVRTSAAYILFYESVQLNN